MKVNTRYERAFDPSGEFPLVLLIVMISLLWLLAYPATIGSALLGLSYVCLKKLIEYLVDVFLVVIRKGNEPSEEKTSKQLDTEEFEGVVRIMVGKYGSTYTITQVRNTIGKIQKED
jgi:hypothetical protein